MVQNVDNDLCELKKVKANVKNVDSLNLKKERNKHDLKVVIKLICELYLKNR